MRRHCEFSFSNAHEHFRHGMREAFPPLQDIPAEMRAALLDLEREGGRPATPQERLDAIASLDEDEKRDAETATRAVI